MTPNLLQVVGHPTVPMICTPTNDTVDLFGGTVMGNFLNEHSFNKVQLVLAALPVSLI